MVIVYQSRNGLSIEVTVGKSGLCDTPKIKFFTIIFTPKRIELILIFSFFA